MRGTPTCAAFLVASMLLLMACTCRYSSSPGVSPELKHLWEANFNRGDAAGVAALYAPDGQLLMSGSEPAQGVAAIREVVENMIRGGAKIHIDSSENVGAGDIAYVFGSYSVRDPVRNQDVEHGTYVEVWKRIQGQWKIHIDINAAGLPVGHL